MSSTEPSAGEGISAPDGLAAAVQNSVREEVKVAASGRAGSRWVVPTLAVAAVAAAACAPVAWPLLAGGAAVSSATLAAAFGQVGGVGGGLLADLVTRAWNRVRGHPDEESGVSQAELRTVLAAEFADVLGASSPLAAELRGEVAGVLQGVDAVQVALTATIETTVGEARDQVMAVLVSGLQEMSSRFAEFDWVRGVLSDQVVHTAEIAAGTRALLEGQQQTLLQLTMLRQEAHPARASDGGPAGLLEIDDADADAERAAALDSAGAPVSHDCPYPGLAAFGPQDGGRFFGREQLTATLITRLAEQLAGPGLLMVLGPSGSGKSSLLRAGLLPAIAAGGLPARGSQAWPVDSLTPTRYPLLELATRIAAISGIPAGALNADLHADPDRITAAVRQALLAHARRQAQSLVPGVAAPGSPVPGSAVVAGVDPLSSRLVLIIDQFEELFTQCPDEWERRAFIRALRTASGVTAAAAGPPSGEWGDRSAPGSSALVVIGIRADFYARCATYPELAPYLQDSQVLVGPMNQAGLRDAIEKPAADAGLVVDAGLVEVLLVELGMRSVPGPAARGTRPGQPAAGAAGSADPPPAGGSYEAGRLPLLAYALQQTWRYREGRRLTVAAYQATGGIDGAIARAADAVYARLDADGKLAAQRLLLRLVSLGEGTADTRRRATMSELTGSADGTGPARTPQAAAERAALTALIQARLLTTDTGADGSDTVTISHEALLTAWPQLREWLSQDRGGQRTQRDLSDAAVAWQAQHRDSSRLFSGTRLAVAHDWAVGHDANLNPDERAFLAASREQERRSARRRRLAVTGLAVLTVVSVGAAGLAIQQSRHAQAERNQAVTNQVTAEAGQLQSTDPSLAAQLDLVHHRLDPGPGSNSVLLAIDNTPLANPLPGQVTTVAFSPSGHTLATASPDGAIRLWSVTGSADATPIGRPLNGHEGVVTMAAFSRDGHTLVTVDRDGTIQLWNVARPADAIPIGQPLTGSLGPIQSAALSPNRDTLAVAGVNGTIQLWNLTSPAHATPIGVPLTGAGGRIWSVTFSPDGLTLATGNDDGTIGLWNVSDPAHAAPIRKPLTGPAGPVFSVTFSPDGRVLAAGDGGGDDTIRLWNVTSPAHATLIGAPLYGPANTVSGVTFSPNGRLLAASSQDDKIRLWNVADPADPSPVGEPLIGSSSSGPVYTVTFSPNGHTLASVGGTGTARLWTIPATVLTGQTGTVDSVAFSPDGKILATASYDDTIQLWNVTSPGSPALLVTLVGVSGSIDSVAFSPDGHILAAASYGGKIQLWNVTRPASANPVGPPMTGSGLPFRSVAFSPDGQTLAAGSTDGTVRLWNVTSPAAPTPIGPPLPARGRAVFSVVFSPDGHTLAAGTFNGTVALWNVANLPDATMIGQPLVETFNNLFTVAFSPDGKTLAVSGADDTIGLWNVTDPARATRVEELAGPTNAVQGVAFSPDGKTLAAGSGDDTIWLWNLGRQARPTGIGHPLTDTNPVFAVAFSPGSHTLATGTAGGTAQLWNLNVSSAAGQICATSSANLTEQQWATYIGQLPYDPPCRRP